MKYKEKLLKGENIIMKNQITNPGLTIITESNEIFKRFKPVFKNQKTTDIRVNELEITRLTEDSPAGVNVLRFGLNMPGDVVGFFKIDKDGFSRPLNFRDKFLASENNDKCTITSNSLLCFKMENPDEITLIGAESFNKTEGTIELEFDKDSGKTQISYKMILDNVKLAPGQELELDSFVIIKGNDLNVLLKQWAELTAEVNGSLIPEKIPTGWNDWQYYRTAKTAKDVLDSAEVIAELKQQGYPLDFVQVDGGFCLHYSEWSQVKPGFSPGIKDLSEKIVGMGLKFGLWFAPYIQNVKTSVVKEHPEWLLKDENGKTIVLTSSNVGESCLIDFTVPGAEEWLRELLRLFVNDWQVTWLKLDGPNYNIYRNGRLHSNDLCRPGHLHDSSKTISEMLNRVFEVIREEAGPDVIVEGEGMMGLALGKIDLHRVQTDNFSCWYKYNNKDKECAPRVYGKEMIMGFLHNRWWCNHRENVILRNYPSEFCHAGSQEVTALEKMDTKPEFITIEEMFTESEFRTQLTAAVMGSGGLLLTDPMKELARTKERFAWISKLLPVYNKAAEIVDAFPEGRYPSIFKTEVDENLLIYSFTNWNEKICAFECKLPKNIEFHAFSVFEKNVIGIVKDTLKITGVSAHDSRIIVLKRKENNPQLLATDLHLLPGTVDIKNCSWNNDVLEIEICHFKQDDNHLFLAANGRKIVDIKTDARRFSIDDFNAEYPVIHFEGNPGKTIFQIKWK
jgi:alpha-galactosidase